MNANWEKKDSWFRKAATFSVEVTHVFFEGVKDVIPSKHGWFIYVYIFETHPMFTRFDDDDSNINCAHALEFHGGCTFRQHIHRAGKKVGIKVGCDYRHYGDEYYEDLSCKEEAGSVFYDADVIFNTLKDMQDDAQEP